MTLHAARERVAAPNLPVPVNRLPARTTIQPRPHGLATGELVKLHHSLAASLTAENGVVAQFVAPQPDPATEAVAYDLAYVSAAWLGKRVLFVRSPSRQAEKGGRTVPAVPPANGRREPQLDAPLDFADAEKSIANVSGIELYHMTLPSTRGSADMAPELRGLPEFLHRLRRAFDLIVIAAPAASEAPLGMLLSRFVDGNILVLRAGATRAPVAAELRDSLVTAGGAVTGAVLTRYRSFVPRFLRRWI